MIIPILAILHVGRPSQTTGTARSSRQIGAG
jgi:hypothetical protein